MKSILAEGHSTLAGHMSQLMANGTITANRIYGVQHNKKKAKRMGMQGMAEGKTGSGSNKPGIGKNAPGASRTEVSDSNNGAVLQTKMPKTATQNLSAPKGTSKFVQAFEAAKKSIAIQTSTESRSKAGGAKPTKSPTAKTKGAGVD